MGGAQSDGRLERGRQAREKIVEAVLTLIEAGDPAPTAGRIAARAGISSRLVYHHFDDLEQLMDVAVERRVQQLEQRVRPLPATGSLESRIEAVVSQRADVLEWVTPVRLAAMRVEPFSQRLRDGRDAGFAKARADLARIFAAELDALPQDRREVTLAALDMATSWGAWHHLRLTLGVAAAAAAMTVALAAILENQTADQPRPANAVSRLSRTTPRTRSAGK